MRYFLIFCRLLVGALFIVSGLIKANDPIGFSYKLEEYFAEAALNLTFLEPYALALAILACTAEVVLGFAVLFGGRMRLASVCLLVLTIFFGWLTAYTASCDPQGTYTVVENGVSVTKEVHCVTDCGCFGDAMKGSIGRSLTPIESFYKDVILFLFIVPIAIASFRKPGIAWNTEADDRLLLGGGLLFVGFFSWVFTWWGPLCFTGVGFAGYLVIKRNVHGMKAEWLSAAWATVLGLAFIWWCMHHGPVRDYRPYAVGRSIAEQKTMGRPPKTEVFLTYKNSATGEQKEFTDKNYPWQDSTWVYVDRRVVELEPGIPSQVQDFVLTDVDGVDVTDGILEEPGPVLLLTSKNIKEAGIDCLPAINALAEAASNAGWYFYGVSASPYEDIEEFRHAHQTPFDFLQCDETTVKTINRSNPGLMLLQAGVVKGQWHCNDIPTFDAVKELVK